MTHVLRRVFAGLVARRRSGTLHASWRRTLRPRTKPASEEELQWPRVVEGDGMTFTIYQPQIDKFADAAPRGPRRGQGRHQSRRQDPDELRRHLDHGPSVHRQGERARRALGHPGHEGELPDRSREGRAVPRDHAREHRAHAHDLPRAHRGQPRHHPGRQEGRGGSAEERPSEDPLPLGPRHPRDHRRRSRPAARRGGLGPAARHQHQEPDRHDGRDLLPLSGRAPGSRRRRRKVRTDGRRRRPRRFRRSTTPSRRTRTRRPST